MTRREQVLSAIEGSVAGISAIDLAYQIGSPESTVRRETQALRAAGLITTVKAPKWSIDKVYFVTAPQRVESHKRYSSMA